MGLGQPARLSRAFAVLAAAATIGWVPGDAAAQQRERVVPLCDLPRDLGRAQLRRIRQRDDFALLLRYASDRCPEVALLLTDTATATITAPAAAAVGGGGGSTPGSTTSGGTTSGDTSGGSAGSQTGSDGGDTGGTDGGSTGGSDGGSTGGSDGGGGR